MSNESNKIRNIIPNVDDRLRMYISMESLANRILAIIYDWWENDEELRQYADPDNYGSDQDISC